MNKIALSIIAVCLASQVNLVYAEKQPSTDKEKFSYAIGLQVSQNISNQPIEIDNASFIQAISDVLNKSKLKLTPQEMQQAVINYQNAEIKKLEQQLKQILVDEAELKEKVEKNLMYQDYLENVCQSMSKYFPEISDI